MKPTPTDLVKQELDLQWKDRKLDNTIIAKSFLRLAHSHKLNDNQFYNLSYHMTHCANYVEFKVFADNTKKLNKVFFCKNRLCPMCNWRRSKKTFAQVSKIINKLDETDNYSYIFLTLTIRNCLPVELEKTIKLISTAFNNMFRGSKRVKTIAKGYFRTIEVTYNKKYNTYHPHIHCIIAVDKSYFHHKNPNYIKQEEWCQIWRDYLKIDYNPSVDVRKVKTKNYLKDGVIVSTNGAVPEVSKYTVKSKDIIIRRKNDTVNEDLTDANIFTLHFALKGKRLVTYGGIMKDLHKQLNLEDMNSDNVDLLNTDVDDSDNLLNYIILKYKWCVGVANYELIT